MEKVTDFVFLQSAERGAALKEVQVLSEDFFFFGHIHTACGILVPQPGIEPAPLALEGEVLTTGLLEKSPL